MTQPRTTEPDGAQTVQDGSFLQTGGFAGGMDSYTNPLQLPTTKYVYGENVACRGGILQTRPGYGTIFAIPCGNLQGMTSFTPTGGKPQLVFAVDGVVYVSPYPFQTYSRLPNIQFYKNAKFIAWAVGQQSTTYDNQGNLVVLNYSKAVLVMQDGFSRAAYWDGNVNMHLNPGPSGVIDPTSGDNVVLPNTFGTPIGLWMVWSNNRLWVTSGTSVYASDIGNPLVFSEQTYLAGLPSFTLPEPATGITEPYYGAPLIIFGNTTQTYIQSQIQDRTQWATTVNFQVTYYGIGCVSHRSIIKQYGLIWWYSQGGIVNLNQATQNTIDSYVNYVDDAMMASKGNLSPDKSSMCGCSFEKYLVLSVPSGSTLNRHTWVLDQSDQPPAGSSFLPSLYVPKNMAWNGVWTGTRPVEWTSIQARDHPRCFYASKDYDGVNRIWEAFLPDRNDNGSPITCVLQTKLYSFDKAGLDAVKDFRFPRIEAQETLGTVDVWGGFAGTTGGYIKNLSKRIVATPGIFGAQQTFKLTDPILAYRPQVRVFEGQEAKVAVDNACNNCGVEQQAPYYRDRAFSQMLIWSGRMGITAVRMFAEGGVYDKFDGSCTRDEVGPNVVNVFGCTGKTDVVTDSPLDSFTATSTAEYQCAPGTYGPPIPIGHGVGKSVISQDNANLLAELAAIQDADDQSQCW